MPYVAQLSRSLTHVARPRRDDPDFRESDHGHVQAPGGASERTKPLAFGSASVRSLVTGFLGTRPSAEMSAASAIGEDSGWAWGGAGQRPAFRVRSGKREAESGTKRKAGRVRKEAESGTGPILLNWAAPPTSERSSPGRGILISSHLSRAPRGTKGRL